MSAGAPALLDDLPLPAGDNAFLSTRPHAPAFALPAGSPAGWLPRLRGERVRPRDRVRRLSAKADCKRSCES